MPIPTNPILFYKPVTSLTGPNTPIPIPTLVQADPGLDYECELVAIIGTPALNVPVANALSYVLGYTAGNDVSHRAWQIRRGGGGQWGLGKSFDGWAPFGPGIVTREALGNESCGGNNDNNNSGSSRSRGDPARLRIGTKVNGEVRQAAETADMVFGVAETVSFLSQGTTLMPGDLIFTGT